VANEPSPGYLPEDPTRARSQIRSHNNLVLLITNNPVASATVSRYLHGCRTITIQDLAQAEVTIHQMMPQVVSLDTSEGGYDTVFIQTIVQHWQSLKTYVIACPLPGQHTVKDKLAAQAYLTKPVSRDDLWDTLRQFGASVDNVLIVDDDRDFVRLVERMLDSPLKRYRISSANSGREALELMKFAVPDVILLDLNMADMDGFSVIERIRATPEWQQVLIVVVSAQDELETSVPLQGQVVISRSDGISSSEILRWLQGMVSDLTGRGYLALLDA
jgi:CheY-like chemotaxis protein